MASCCGSREGAIDQKSVAQIGENPQIAEIDQAGEIPRGRRIGFPLRKACAGIHRRVLVNEPGRQNFRRSFEEIFPPAYDTGGRQYRGMREAFMQGPSIMAMAFLCSENGCFGRTPIDPDEVASMSCT